MAWQIDPYTGNMYDDSVVTQWGVPTDPTWVSPITGQSYDTNTLYGYFGGKTPFSPEWYDFRNGAGSYDALVKQTGISDPAYWARMWEQGDMEAMNQANAQEEGDFIESGGLAKAIIGGVAGIAGGALAGVGPGVLSGAEAAGAGALEGAGAVDAAWGVNAAETAAETIPELGLVANPATADAAIAAGISPEMLSGGAGALTLADVTPTSLTTPPTPPTNNSGGDDVSDLGTDETNPADLVPDELPGGTTSMDDLIKLFGDNAKWILPLLGAGVGAVGADSKPAGTTTTVQDIPDWQKPYVMGLMDAASKAFGGTDLSKIAAGNETANQEMLKTMGGGYLPTDQFNPFGGRTTSVPTNPYFGMNNPYLEKALSTNLNDITGRVQAQAYGGGAFGGSANQELLARNLADAANQTRYQDFYNQAQLGEADVNRRLATSLADTTRNAGLWNTDMARNLANFQTERGRQFAASAGYPDFQTAQTQATFSPFTAYGNIVGRNFGSTTSTPYFSNPWGGALSGAMGGFALSKAFGA